MSEKENIKYLKKEDMEIIKLDSVENLIPERKEANLSYWQGHMEKGDIFEVEFPLRDKGGDLYCYYGDICIRLPIEEIYGKKSKAISDNDTRANYPVIVMRIMGGTVYVSYVKAMDAPRNSLIKMLDEALERQQHVRIQGRLIGFAGRVEKEGRTISTIALVDIAGLGVIGYIRLVEWSADYTNSFDYVATKGQIVDVVVLKKFPWQSGMVYDCSRRLAMDRNPLDGIQEKLPRGTRIKVRCVALIDSRHFIGQIMGIDDVSAFCEFKNEDGFAAIPGSYYYGKIHKINEKEVNVKRKANIYVDILDMDMEG